MPRPTPPVKRVCYVVDISLGFWTQNPTSGIHDQHLPEGCRHLSEGKLVYGVHRNQQSHSSPRTHSSSRLKITIENTQLLLERIPMILGVIMDPSLSFYNHCNYVTDRINKRNNMLKALVGSSWGQNKKALS